MTLFMITPRDVILTIGILLVLAVLLIYTVHTWIKQRLCKHRNIYENRACMAICHDCGKDLGFIGTWRKQQKGTQ